MFNRRSFSERQLALSRLEIKQPSFAPHFSAIATDIAFGIHDPVTGNHDSDWVVMICHAHRTHGARIPDTLRNRSVRTRLSVWDAQQFAPDLLLKAATAINQRQIERAQVACEIAAQLLDRSLE